MQVILFRPFDAGKWFAIGLSAFLAGLISGGNGFNSSFNGNNFNDVGHKGSVHTAPPNIHDMVSKILTPFATWQMGFVIVAAIVVFVIILALGVLFCWLGSRGQFMFLDNIVRNRGAIAWPWQAYSRLGNSFFLVHLLLMAVSFVIFIPLVVIAVIMCIPLYQQDRWPLGTEIGGFVFLGGLYFVLYGLWATFLFLFREFAVAIMFRRGITALPAIKDIMGLVMQNPGSILLFLLLRFAIFLGVAVISVIVCCATCCIGALPYIGTVLLLPALIFVRCFTLDCLAQFGPEYDVFTVDVPTEPPAASGWTPGGASPFSPPPPLG